MSDRASRLPQPLPDTWRAGLARLALRLVPSLGIKPRWWVGAAAARVPAAAEGAGPVVGRGPVVEVVSHCWNYAPLLTYQLSSLVLAPPEEIEVVMTVCYCPDDAETTALLAFFGDQVVPRVRWNWLALPREGLLRRGFGRNLAARASVADWVWFTDCDLVFAAGALDGLGRAVAGSRAPLVYPREERCTRMLLPDDPVLSAGRGAPRVLRVDFERFSVQRPRQATGPLQITRGDVARQLGYCGALPCCLTAADRWRKTYEDRAFRWLLGTAGQPLDVPGVYRIKHVVKGRYDGSWWSRLRSRVRQAQDRGRSAG